MRESTALIIDLVKRVCLSLPSSPQRCVFTTFPLQHERSFNTEFLIYFFLLLLATVIGFLQSSQADSGEREAFLMLGNFQLFKNKISLFFTKLGISFVKKLWTTMKSNNLTMRRNKSLKMETQTKLLQMLKL